MSAQTIRELDRVVLTSDVSAEGLVVGDVGTVVLIHQEGKGYEVEFTTLDGATVVVATRRLLTFAQPTSMKSPMRAIWQVRPPSRGPFFHPFLAV